MLHKKTLQISVEKRGEIERIEMKSNIILCDLWNPVNVMIATELKYIYSGRSERQPNCGGDAIVRA
jgi:hypothetical protein